METLEEEAETADYQLDKKPIPTEIMEDIFSILPVKSILRFRSLSKPWLSRLSSPSFTKLHSTRPHRTSLFISAYDCSTRKQHFLSAGHEGGPLTHLVTLDDVDSDCIREAQHLNGLVFFARIKRCSVTDYAQVFVVNPSSHNIFKLPVPDPDPDSDPDSKYLFKEGCYLFGFDESKNEHKILIIRKSSHITEIMIYSMLNYSWRKIYLEPPVGFDWDSLDFEFEYDYYDNVCVNSVVHLLFLDNYDILGFDLRTENFLIINTPEGVDPRESGNRVPYIIKINGCVGVVCYDSGVVETNEMHIWILQDYENRVWVKETITFPEPGYCFPFDSVDIDEVIFCSHKQPRNLEKSIYIYNRKSRCFKALQFYPGHQFSLSRTLQVNQVKCYVESMIPL